MRRFVPAVAVLLAACNAPSMSIELTEEEATALFKEGSELLRGWVPLNPRIRHGHVTCYNGGTINIVIDVTVDSIRPDTLLIRGHYASRSRECGMTAAGEEYTVSGIVADDWTVKEANSEVIVTGTVNGQWNWARGEYHGECPLEVGFTGEPVDTMSLRFSHKGRVCGHEATIVTTVRIWR